MSKAVLPFGGGCEANETIALAAGQLTANFIGAGIAEELANRYSQQIITACYCSDVRQNGDTAVAATAAYIGQQVVTAHKLGQPFTLEKILKSNLDRSR